jgi:hypothetical protein
VGSVQRILYRVVIAGVDPCSPGKRGVQVNPKTKRYVEGLVQTASVSLQARQDALDVVRGYLQLAEGQKTEPATQKAFSDLLRVRQMELANAAAALRAYQNILDGKEPFA